MFKYSHKDKEIKTIKKESIKIKPEPSLREKIKGNDNDSKVFDLALN